MESAENIKSPENKRIWNNILSSVTYVTYDMLLFQNAKKVSTYKVLSTYLVSTYVTLDCICKNLLVSCFPYESATANRQHEFMEILHCDWLPLKAYRKQNTRDL